VKIGVISDIHGNIGAFEAAWRALALESVDMVVNLGDLVHFGPFPEECVSFAREHEMESIQGNCDRAAARGRQSTGDVFVNSHWERMSDDLMDRTRASLSKRSLNWLRDLPEELRFDLDGRRYLFTHGLPGNISGSLPAIAADEVFDIMISRNNCDALVLGHTHEPALVRRDCGWILNPGSVGGGTLPSGGTVMVIEPSKRNGPSASWTRISFDFEAYASASRDAGIPAVFTRAVECGRDPRGEWHTRDTRWRQRWAEL
jgi:putative phosphoesterase